MLDYSKPSTVLVYDLINRDNPNLPIPVSIDNCVVEKITNVAVNAASNFRNTSARIRGVQGSGFRDIITVYYDRVSVATLFPWYGRGVPTAQAAAFTTFTAPNIHAALSVLLDTYGINFGTMDITNYALGGVSQPNYTTIITIAALLTSPAYTGAANVYYKRGLPVLDTSITVDTLNVLAHPIDITLNKKCVDMLTYGIDFTAYKNMLTVTSAGLPNWAGLRGILDGLGIPAYDAPENSNTVQDVATTTAQFANKAYDRVVIQTGIDNTGAKGVAYYHYNN